MNLKRRALVSVSDKSGVVEFCRGLVGLGFEIVSTGGTARTLEEEGVEVTPVIEITGEPEILGGRVKTLHPRVHGGILADLEDPEHAQELVEHGIGRIELVCVNLYPFEETVASGASEKEVVENIDIGGPAMMRAAAKNFRSVTVVPSPEFYDGVLSELEGGQVSLETRRRLSLAAFRRAAAYDSAISRWLGGEEFPEGRVVAYEKVSDLRYGENPHQSAAYYSEVGSSHLLSGVEQLQGKELSFNNLYDIDAARTLLADLDGPAAVIVKHANPCGAAVGRSLTEAYRKAFDSDPTSAFGGIVSLNGDVDGELAREISDAFTEVLIALGFSQEAREIFAEKQSMILLQADKLPRPELAAKPVTGGVLLQEADAVEDGSEYRVVTEARPTENQMQDLHFAWKVARQVKSNAIVLVRDGATVGVGAGQMSRLDSAEISIKKAGDKVNGAVAASDAFFPFADGVERLAEAGIGAVIHPGGSRRDEEVIEAAERYGVAMVFTGRRHFLH